MDSATDSFRDCLCLLCRKTGHVVEKCPHYDDGGPDTPSPPDNESPCPSPPFDPLPTVEEPAAQTLCARCSKLDALSEIASLEPLVQADLEDTHKGYRRSHRKTLQIPSLGPIPSLRLLSTCPLCRIIFNMTDLVEAQDMYVGELVMVPVSTIHRIEPDLCWEGWGKKNGRYATCVYTSMTTQWYSAGTYQPQRLAHDAMDAIGVLDVGESGQESATRPALGIRRVDPTTPDYSTIKGWLRRCENLHHTTCHPLVSENLKQIKLVDVESRHIAMYPPGGCDYIALSYVWGNVEQRSYELGEVLETVPATIEDAMSVTRRLGQQYLWADCLCIDQEDPVEKAEQMAHMSAIYSGAWATIICLSGRSAGSRLPRVGTLQDVIPQLSCEIWGKKLLSVMPTLEQQISRSPWGSRAWTYQEGLLSPRRLFFTNHQVYFECNSVQCCESLDDSNSPFHLLSDKQRRAALDDVVNENAEQDLEEFDNGGPEGVIGRGVLRDPFRPISHDEEAQTDGDNFARYLRLVCEYTGRELTHDVDSLDAFSAILTRLEEKYYKVGFVQGLPVEDLPRALAWYHLEPPRRREGFPAWTWVGWDGGLGDTPVQGTEDSYDAIMAPLRIWKPGKDDQPELVYNFDPTPGIISELKERLEESWSQDEADDEEDSVPLEVVKDSDSSSKSESGSIIEELSNYESPKEIDFENDPVFRLAKEMFEKDPTALPAIERNELLIEGIVIRLGLTGSPDSYSDSMGSTETVELCFVRIEGQDEPQRLRFYGHDAKVLADRKYDDEQEFLLLGREHYVEGSQMIYNALLLINRDGDVASRVGVASLRLERVEMLGNFKPERKLFKLR